MCIWMAAKLESWSDRQLFGTFTSRGSVSAARACAYPVISRAGMPPGMMTRATGCWVRSRACTEKGSAKYSAPRCSTTMSTCVIR